MTPMLAEAVVLDTSFLFTILVAILLVLFIVWLVKRI